MTKDGKSCCRCGEHKPWSEFHKNRTTRDGHVHMCKTCTREYHKVWRDANPEKVRVQAEKRKPKAREAWAAMTQEEKTEKALKAVLRKHCLTLDEYLALGDACAICGSAEDLVIDHDHLCCPPIRDRQGDLRTDSCGKCVRGRLCRNHNLGLGYFNDDIEGLRAAIRYLEGS